MDAEYFREKYPDLPPDAVVDRRIKLARYHAALAGAVTAGAYTGAVAATIGTAGGASAVALPAAAATLAADLLYLSWVQLQLAYDLSILYGEQIDTEDPEDIHDLLRLAFGIKAGEAFQGALVRLSPEAVRVGVKATATGARLTWLKALPVVGKYLLQRNIIKAAIPAVGIPLNAGLNYFFTGAIGKNARVLFRDKAASREAADRMAREAPANPMLLLKVLWLVVQADARTAPQEATLLKELTARIRETAEGPEILDEFKALVEIDPESVWYDVREADEMDKRILFDAACATAAIDHEIHKQEIEILEQLAECCGTEFDVRALKKTAKP